MNRPATYRHTKTLAAACLSVSKHRTIVALQNTFYQRESNVLIYRFRQAVCREGSKEEIRKRDISSL